LDYYQGRGKELYLMKPAEAPRQLSLLSEIPEEIFTQQISLDFNVDHSSENVEPQPLDVS